MEQKKFRYIKKPSWSGEEGPLYEAPEINEVLRVLFDEETTGVKQLSAWETTFPPGWELPLHTHPAPVEEFLYVLRGRGIERVADEEREVGPGSAVFIPPDVPHGLRNTGDEMIVLLVVVSPPGIIEKSLYVKPLKRVTPVWEKEYL